MYFAIFWKLGLAVVNFWEGGGGGRSFLPWARKKFLGVVPT